MRRQPEQLLNLDFWSPRSVPIVWASLVVVNAVIWLVALVRIWQASDVVGVLVMFGLALLVLAIFDGLRRQEL